MHFGVPHVWKPPYVHIQPDGSFTVPWFFKNVVLVLAKSTFWVQKSFFKQIHRKMLSSTLPAFCGQKRSEFGFPFFSSQLCRVEARFGQQVCRVHLPAPLCAADVLPQQGMGFGSTLWNYLIWHTSFQNGPTDVSSTCVDLHPTT